MIDLVHPDDFAKTMTGPRSVAHGQNPVSDQSPRFSFTQVGEPGGQQPYESGFPEIWVITQEFLDGLDVFWHFSVRFYALQ
jgi:hypothetical protein